MDTMTQAERDRAALNRQLTAHDHTRISPRLASEKYAAMIHDMPHGESNALVGEDYLSNTLAAPEPEPIIYPSLSTTERQVLWLISYGASREEVMKLMSMSRRDYTEITQGIYSKFEVERRSQAAFKFHEMLQWEMEQGIASGESYGCLRTFLELRGGTLPEPLWTRFELTPLQHDIMRLWCDGATGTEIENMLQISHNQFANSIRTAYTLLDDAHDKDTACDTYRERYSD